MAKKILIADDSAGIRMLLEFYLEQNGYDVVTASDGDEAIELTLKENPALILMDMQMPVKDGYEACEYLRQEKGFDRQQLPIIALSASDSASDLARAENVGCNRFLAKPVGMEDMLNAIEAEFNQTTPANHFAH
jgi:CheY-like chemotaxis protein